jgi:hypothetical protein
VPVNGYGALAVLAALGAGWWVWGLWRRPYKRCRTCKGTGRVAGSRSRRWGYCPACNEKPPIPRLGAATVAAAVGERYGKRYW